MKKSYLCIGATVFVFFYMFRSKLPMLYWGNSITVEINLPSHIVPYVGGDYISSDCQRFTTSNMSWISGRRSGDARITKISDTKYLAKVYLKDLGPCNWRLQSIGWYLNYKDASSVLRGATSAEGGDNTIEIGTDAYFTAMQRSSENYSNAETLVISRRLTPHVSQNRYTGEWGFYIGNINDNRFDRQYYYNPYQYIGRAKIIYNVSVDESSLQGMSAQDAYRLQEEQLAKERKGKQEQEEADRQRIRTEIAEDRRKWEMAQAKDNTGFAGESNKTTPLVNKNQQGMNNEP